MKRVILTVAVLLVWAYFVINGLENDLWQSEHECEFYKANIAVLNDTLQRQQKLINIQRDRILTLEAGR